MTLDVLLFAAAREAAGAHRVSVDVPDDATVADVVIALAARNDELAAVLMSCRIAVDQRFARREDRVHESSVVAVLPPVSGG